MERSGDGKPRDGVLLADLDGVDGDEIGLDVLAFRSRDRRESEKYENFKVSNHHQYKGLTPV